MTRKRWLALVAGVALLAGLGAGGVVLAQSAGDEDGSPTFLERVAQKLGIDTPKLQDAIKGAANDEVDQAVQEGRLTEEQAQKIKERIAAAPEGGPFPFFGIGPGFDGPHGFRGGKAFGFAVPFGCGARLDELAGFLGVTTEQLRDELNAENATPASVAGAHGKSRDELKAFIRGKAKERLDQAVADGHLTQERADEILGDLDERLDGLIDREFVGGLKPFGPGRGFGPWHRGAPDEMEPAPTPGM